MELYLSPWRQLFLTEVPGIRNIKSSKNKDHLTVKLVKAKELSRRHNFEDQQKYHKILGDEVAIDVLLVDEIPREKSGKFKLFKTTFL